MSGRMGGGMAGSSYDTVFSMEDPQEQRLLAQQVPRPVLLRISRAIASQALEMTCQFAAHSIGQLLRTLFSHQACSPRPRTVPPCPSCGCTVRKPSGTSMDIRVGSASQAGTRHDLARGVNAVAREGGGCYSFVYRYAFAQPAWPTAHKHTALLRRAATPLVD